MAQQDEQLRGAVQSIYDFFTVAERRFRAPEFQRHYVWRADGASPQIRRFWEDFEQLRSDGQDREAKLFLGAIVLQVVDSGGPDGVPLLSIIDGQQRILTIYLILAALADWYQTSGRADAAGEIERRYLLNQASGIRDTPRVEPTLNDTKQFYSLLSCLKNPSPIHPGPSFGPEDHNLTRAWRAIHRKVGELAKDDEGELSVERLNQLRSDLLTRIDVVAITLGSRHDPHEVYERLNIGGEPLKPIDLIRNAVFLTIGSDHDAASRIYQHHWDPFESELGLEHQDKYVIPYAAIRDAATTKATLYPKLRQYWRNSRRPAELSGEGFGEWIVNDLREFLPAYRAIVGAAKPPTMEPDSWDQLVRLHRIDVPEMTYPYLMQLVQAHLKGDVSQEELTAVVDLLDSFFVRRAFAGLRNTGMNPVFRTAWEASKQSIDDMQNRLDTRTVQFPSDDQFAHDIKTTAIYQSSRCAYILHEYERSFARGDKVREVLNPTIDHLMPQNPRPGTWQHVSADDHQRLLHTWSNLVPMGDANALKGVMTWEDARELVLEDQASFFRSTVRVFKENEHWGVEEIEARADKLVRWALQRWPKS